MENKRISSVILLGITSVFDWQQTRAASAAVNSLAAEVAVRKADADWAAAARTSKVDTWMSFYAVDAIVLLPNDQLASGKELARRAVIRLFALPHLLVEWRPIEVTVPLSGDLAFLIGSYERRFDDSHGMPVSDRGRRLEVWRKQTDGTWRCIVDTWNLDPTSTVSSVAPSSGAQGISSAAGSAPPLVKDIVPPSAVALESGPPARVHESDSKYGAMPIDYKMTMRKYLLEHLKHPESVQFQEISRPEHGYTTKITGGLLMREKHEYGWTVKATINAKDSRNNYVGFKTYTFLFRGEEMVDARSPLPADETN